MRDTCNQSVKRGREAMSHWLGEGEKSRCCKRRKKKKGSSKRRMGLENPGEGAAGALVFLGINVTVLLLDQGRHREPMSSRG